MGLPIELMQSLHGMPVFFLEAAEPQVGSLDWILRSNVFNVVLVAVILGWLMNKFNLLGGIDTTQAKIATEIQTVEKQKQDALKDLEEAKRRTANLKAEIEEILSNARESAESLSTQILTDARTESTKIVEQAHKRVELEQRSAMRDLEARLLNDALSDARMELGASMKPADQKRSVEAFLDELSQRGTAQGGKR